MQKQSVISNLHVPPTSFPGSPRTATSGCFTPRLSSNHLSLNFAVTFDYVSILSRFFLFFFFFF